MASDLRSFFLGTAETSPAVHDAGSGDSPGTGSSLPQIEQAGPDGVTDPQNGQVCAE